MNINRHNYEEFFLLYVDKELSAADSKTVELFVQQNADLREELMMLQQVVMDVEEVSFDSKSLLFKEESITALQENLLLLADDELTASEKNKLLQLIATDATVAAEWNILQQTKLSAGKIIFADKQLLYKETEPAKVVGIRWWRVAIAAALIGFSVWGGLALYSNSNSDKTGKADMVANGDNKNNIAGQQDKSTTQPNNNIVADKNAEKENKVPQQNNSTRQGATDNKNLAVTVPPQNSKQPAIDKKDNNINNNNNSILKEEPVQKETLAAVDEKELNKKPSNNLPTPLYNNINNNNGNKNIIANVPPIEPDANNANNGIALAKNSLQQKMNGTDPSTNPIAKNTVLKEGEDASFINTDNKKRSKLGGLLRKITRVITRTTNAPQGDGKSVKIAGFDIAIN